MNITELGAEKMGDYILEQTKDVVTADELRKITGFCGILGDVVQTCAGAWQIEPDGRYRFWQDPDWDT